MSRLSKRKTDRGWRETMPPGRNPAGVMRALPPWRHAQGPRRVGWNGFVGAVVIAILAAAGQAGARGATQPTSASPSVGLVPAGGTQPAPSSPMELEQFGVERLDWLTTDLLQPAGKATVAEMPDTLDLADRARLAVGGLTSFLDPRHRYSSFGHGNFSRRPGVFIHDDGRDQNWGKIAEATVLARGICGGRQNIDIQRASLEAMLSYAQLKKEEPYPVPLARMTMALESLYRQHPHPQLAKAIGQHVEWLQAKMVVDPESQQAYFGPADRRWERDDQQRATGPNGYWIQVFTGGNVLRALVRASTVPGVKVDALRLAMLKNYLLDPRFWTPEAYPALVVPAEHGQFWGHHHSYAQALLGLLYYGHRYRDTWVLEFVRRAYHYLRTFGLARIGLFGEGCTTGDMTYLAVRMSQWGLGDYWEDVDQYVRNHLAELQIRDVARLAALVEKQPPLDPATLGAWCQGLDTHLAIQRSVGLFWSDATHPTLIPLFADRSPHASCLQWVVCCSGNCTKALAVVWEGMVEADPAARLVRVHLLLNRVSPWVDVESDLPYDGRVTVHLKQDADLALRVPLWVDRHAVRCHRGPQQVQPPWVGRYILLRGLRAGQTVAVTFPVTQTVETHLLAWQSDQFWLESTRAPDHWPKRPPVTYTLVLRGNTLVDIRPRDTQPGFALYTERTPQRYRLPVPRRRLECFEAEWDGR